MCLCWSDLWDVKRTNDINIYNNAKGKNIPSAGPSASNDVNIDFVRVRRLGYKCRIVGYSRYLTYWVGSDFLKNIEFNIWNPWSR